MKLLSETQAIERLETLREEFRDVVSTQYEHKAAPCSQCKTPGACCLDEHFVNVRVSRLEAAALRRAIGELPDELRKTVGRRVDVAIEKYELKGEPFDKKYSCPLYEKGVGCLVHATAKPLPCIAHACYESESDLPPDSLLEEYELLVDKLNERVYGRGSAFWPIPIAITQFGR